MGRFITLVSPRAEEGAGLYVKCPKVLRLFLEYPYICTLYNQDYYSIYFIFLFFLVGGGVIVFNNQFEIASNPNLGYE